MSYYDAWKATEPSTEDEIDHEREREEAAERADATADAMRRITDRDNAHRAVDAIEPCASCGQQPKVQPEWSGGFGWEATCPNYDGPGGRDHVHGWTKAEAVAAWNEAQIDEREVSDHHTTLGPVQHGLHDGACDGCEAEPGEPK